MVDDQLNPIYFGGLDWCITLQFEFTQARSLHVPEENMRDLGEDAHAQ